MNHPLRALAAAAGAAALSVGGVAAAPAGAHVEPSPASVEAGSTATIDFDVEHGCGESPLVKVEIKVPDEVTGASAAPAPAGWTGSMVGDVVTFTGGPQPSHQAIVFSVTASMPDTPGSTLVFPVIETCQEGTVEWLAPPAEGGEEPEHPAPVVVLTKGAPTPEEEAPAENVDEGPADTPATTSTTTTVAEGAEAASPAAAAEKEEEPGSNALLVAAAVVAVLVVVGGTAYVLVRRRSAAPGTDRGSNP